MKRGLKPIYRPAIVRLLSIGPLTVAEIAVRLPCCLTTAYDNVRELRKAGTGAWLSKDRQHDHSPDDFGQRAGCTQASVLHGNAAYAKDAPQDEC